MKASPFRLFGSRFSPSSSLCASIFIPMLAASAAAQGQYQLDGGTGSVSSAFTYDGESIGDTFIPQAPYFESTGQRDAFLVRGGGTLTLSAGADVSVINNANHTAFARVGYGTNGALVIAADSILRVGQATRYANFHVGHDATGLVNQTGGSASFIGSVNIGANGGNGTYTISGGTFNFDQTSDGGTSLLTVGFNNSAAGSDDSTGTFNINGGAVNILSSHGGSTQFILGNRVNTALGSSNPSGTGNGTLNQTAGTFTIGAGANLFLSGYGNGTYNFSGGTLQIGGTSLNESYAGAGEYDFNLSGGTIRVTGSDLVTAVDMNLTSGTSTIDTNGLNATLTGTIDGPGTLVKSGSGQLNLEGNVARSFGALSVSAGTTDHRAGTTGVGALLVGAYSPGSPSGSMTLSGGTLNVTSPASAAYIGAGGNSGTLDITGGTLNLGVTSDPSVRVEFYVGAFGATSTGTVNHSGGVVNKLSDEGTFQIGNQATGIYNLSGTGELNIYGPNSIVLGRSVGSNAGNGTLNISGGSLNFFEGADLSIGGAQASEPAGLGTGIVNQTGGTVSMGNGSVVIGQRGNGTYNLNGGILEIGGTNRLRQGVGGTATFNLGGGTLRVAGSALTSGLDINVTAGNSVIDTNGLNATLSGDLAGNGTLYKIGAGNLNLSGDNNLTGSFYVAGGAVNQTGGDSTVRYFAVGSGSGYSGDFTITGGGLEITNALQIGDFGGTSTFTIDGGDVFVGEITNGAALNIGNQGGTGTLNLESGSLTLGYGIHALGRMDNRPTGTPAGSGTINVDGGLLEIVDGGSLILGDRILQNSNTGLPSKDAWGSGELNQTGGIVRVTDGSLFIAGFGANASGTYNLDGGTLEIGGTSLRARYNNSVSQTNFNLGGGLIKVIGSQLQTDVHFNLRDNTVSTFDTGTFGASVSGFAGTGDLIKTGLSNLAIASDSSIRKLTVNQGSVSSTADVTVTDLHLGASTSFSGTGSLQVNGRFTGTGNLGIATRIDGTLAVGNSPGILSVSTDLTIGAGAVFEMDLSGDEPGIAGLTFDQIDLSLGKFEMEDGAIFSIGFDDVDFNAAFWDTSRSWLVVDGDGTGEVVVGDVTLTGSEDY
ncbi:MAG TPA: hypothetical protein VM511_04385, partial [Luteolibacter sp.]|nr:hypothetical protein [Luteolibacter sp.]